MSTNYYTNGLHIGKKSCGWKFLWRSYPELDIFTKQNWFHYIVNNFLKIYNEYDEKININDFFLKITVNDGKENIFSYKDSNNNLFSLKEFS